MKICRHARFHVRSCRRSYRASSAAWSGTADITRSGWHLKPRADRRHTARPGLGGAVQRHCAESPHRQAAGEAKAQARAAHGSHATRPAQPDPRLRRACGV